MAYRAHRLPAVPARSQWPATIVMPPRDLHIYVRSSPLRWTAKANKKPVACRAYTSTVGTPPPFPISSNPKAESSLAGTPGSLEPVKIESSSAHTSGSPKLTKKPQPQPDLVVFHNPASTASMKMLTFLHGAQSAYPQTKRRTGPPLDFRLTVMERLPTAKELQDMYSLLNESSWTIFRSGNTVSNYRHHPTSARSLLDGIEHERQEEITKAKLKTHDNAFVPKPPTSDLPLTEPSATELPTDKYAVLDIDHPLFGTHSFPWPVLVCSDAKKVIVGPRMKFVHRLLRDFANDRDEIIVKTEEQIKEEAEKAKQANWTYPEKEVSPDEDDILKWFSESSKKPAKKSYW